MSRYYRMHIAISEYDAEREEAIRDAADEEWAFPLDNWTVYAGALHNEGESFLCGGEGEEEFADRISAAIMKANNGPCQVAVDATYLEDLPSERHVRDADDWPRLKALKEDA